MSAIAAGIVAGGAIIGGIGGAAISSGGAQGAALTQAQAAQNATSVQQQEFAQQQANQAPWLKAGQGALSQMQAMNAAGPPQFTQQDFLNNQDPAYQFDLQQGQQALQRSAAAQGSLMSGGTLKDLTTYSQGQASNEYQNAYNRFMNGQNTQFNRLASVAGMGQTATGQLNQGGMNMANNVSGTMSSLGNAQGASQIAQGNVWGDTLSSLGSGAGNTFMQGQANNNMNNLLNRMYPQTGGTGGGSGGGNFTPDAQQSSAGLLVGD